MKLRPDATIAEVLAKRPGAMRVFARNGMQCPLCCLADLETVGSAAAAYGVDVRRLLRDIDRETETR